MKRSRDIQSFLKTKKQESEPATASTSSSEQARFRQQPRYSSSEQAQFRQQPRYSSSEQARFRQQPRYSSSEQARFSQQPRYSSSEEEQSSPPAQDGSTSFEDPPFAVSPKKRASQGPAGSVSLLINGTVEPSQHFLVASPHDPASTPTSLFLQPRKRRSSSGLSLAERAVESRDVQVRSMEQTVTHAEKYLGQICSLLASYTRKTAKLRDKADLLVAQLFDFSRTEDPEVQIGLRNLAEDLAMVQDYRQAQVERLETRVISPLKAYGDVVKSKRADLKKFNTDLNRELKELQKVEKIRLRNPADRQSISQAEVNAQKASNNAQRSIRQLEETITDFQRQKLEDIKRIFTDFITVEMLFHAKALEVYTHTYDNLEAMNTQKDLELFNGRVQMSDSLTGHLDTPLSSYSSPLMSHYPNPRLASQKGQGPRSMLGSAPTSQNPRQQSQYPATTRRSRSTFQRQRGVEEEEELEGEGEDEEEDEELEEEEMYESEIEEGQHTSRQSYAAQYAEMRRWQK